MKSRMERYYNTSTNRGRTKANERLYEQIYQDDSYSNIAAVATLEKTNEIDLSKVKDLIKSREEYNKVKGYRDFLPKRETPKIEVNEEPEEEKDYDIKSILEKAKSERDINDELEARRRLRNTQFDILKNLNIHDEKPKKINNIDNNDIESEELKNLINTITSTGVLNKMGDDDLSLSLLSDLKPSGNTIVKSSSLVASVIEEEKKAEEKKKHEDEMNIDKSFYTSSLNFSKDDFEDFKDVADSTKKSNKVIIIIVTMLIIVIGVAVAYLLLKK